MPAPPCSLTMTSPEARPSSRVRNAPVSYVEPATTGKTLIFSYAMGLRRRQPPSPLGGSGAGEGLGETKPMRPRDEIPSKLPKRAERRVRSMGSLQRRGSVDGARARLEVERGERENLRREVDGLRGNERRDYLLGVPKLPPSPHPFFVSVENTGTLSPLRHKCSF